MEMSAVRRSRRRRRRGRIIGFGRSCTEEEGDRCGG